LSPPAQGGGWCLAVLGDGGRRVYYFEGNHLRSVHVETLEPQHLLTVPADRRPCPARDRKNHSAVTATGGVRVP